MENSSKALYIATSVFVAVLILSLVVMMFKKMSDSQKAREKMYDEKNIAAFNSEYEAFNKRLMYGADVISCINKAISNNKEADDANDPDLYIDIIVKMDANLEEKFKIYKIKNGRTITIDTSKDVDDIENVITNFKNNKTEKITKLFNITNTNMYTSFSNFSSATLSDLKFSELASSWNDTQTVPVLKTNDEYSLLKDGKIPNDTKNDNPLGFLVNTREEFTYNFTVNGNNYCIKWTTLFKEFRKKAFSCTNVEYNADTGRVNKMIFEGKTKNK